MSKFSRIIATGSFLPPERVSNAQLVSDLAKHGVESSDEWIVERTGISARHFAQLNVCSSDLAFEACVRCLLYTSPSPRD